ncbi:MAG TPA: EAL domain-containing protein [Cycloclasticus sp.]|jgi:diguanylate cyclase (GGDEF)-like protein/PAS domain S-box-containing protein|nr:EAL domain-containing protein [Cycloclasticus sp.]
MNNSEENSIEAERAHTRVTLESLREGVISTDPAGVITYINPSAEKLLVMTAEKAVGQPLKTVFKLLDEQTRLPILLSSSQAMVEQKEGDIELNGQPILQRADDTEIAIEWDDAPIKNEQGDALGLVITFHDISDAHNLKLQLKYQATHDGLTGLLNRVEFDRRLQGVLNSSSNQQATHALIYIDLDQFKVVSDTCGHPAGDELLKQLSSLISPQVRGRDTLARIGGDEFAVLLEYCPQRVSIKISETLLQTIQGFQFLWGEKSFDVGASMGVVYFSVVDGVLNDPLHIAEKACYKAKELGRNRIHEVNLLGDNDHTAESRDEMAWVNKINQAIEDDRYVLYQQTIAPTNPLHEENISYEVLIRMLDEKGELVPPSAFLPTAERYNIISKLDHYVIKKTFRWLAEHPDVLAATHQCSINLSGPSLSEAALPKFVSDCFDTYSIPFEKICFEITETSVIENLDVAKKFMTELQQQGCIFALDDFGTGMSSFSYLKQLPVNKLKIDGTFVRDIAKDPIDLAMTRSINDIGHVMGMQTVAEFVEDAEILQLLKEIGVDYAQGYHIAKPEPLESLVT